MGKKTRINISVSSISFGITAIFIGVVGIICTIKETNDTSPIYTLFEKFISQKINRLLKLIISIAWILFGVYTIFNDDLMTIPLTI
ncbi:MAG: hypothetical protein GX638_04090 [Crenarchaeota archaeon]|nr:hypothetical protein [Thermoproteota archaeon]